MTDPTGSTRRCGGCAHLKKWNEMEKMTLCLNRTSDHYGHFIHHMHPASDKCFKEREDADS